MAIKSRIKDQFKANFSQMSNKVIKLTKMSRKVKCYEQMVEYLRLVETDDSKIQMVSLFNVIHACEYMLLVALINANLDCLHAHDLYKSQLLFADS